MSIPQAFPANGTSHLVAGELMARLDDAARTELLGELLRWYLPRVKRSEIVLDAERNAVGHLVSEERWLQLYHLENPLRDEDYEGDDERTPMSDVFADLRAKDNVRQTGQVV